MEWEDISSNFLVPLSAFLKLFLIPLSLSCGSYSLPLPPSGSAFVFQFYFQLLFELLCH